MQRDVQRQIMAAFVDSLCSCDCDPEPDHHESARLLAHAQQLLPIRDNEAWGCLRRAEDPYSTVCATIDGQILATRRRS